MSWNDIMRRILSPIGSVQPHITGPAGMFGAGEAEGRKPPLRIPHPGADFDYIGGQTSRLNLSHPALRSPVDGVVENAGEGTMGRITIRDKDGYLHEILRTEARHVTKGDPVVAGQIIGTMGNTGVHDQRVHYQLKDPAGRVIDPVEFWDEIGPIDPNPGSPSFFDQSQRSAEIISGLDEKSSRNGGVPPDRPGNRFFNPFNQAPVAGFVPLPITAASDVPANFAGRFGSWAAQPGLNQVGATAPQAAPKQGKRSESPNEGAPETAKATPRAWPFLTADASSPGGVLKYGPSEGTQTASPPADPNAPDFSPEATTGSDNVPERRLVGRVVNLSAPLADAPTLVSNRPAASVPNRPPAPPLGIFSGKPMLDWPVRPSIFQPRDQSSPDDNELYQRWLRWADA